MCYFMKEMKKLARKLKQINKGLDGDTVHR